MTSAKLAADSPASTTFANLPPARVRATLQIIAHYFHHSNWPWRNACSDGEIRRNVACFESKRADSVTVPGAFFRVNKSFSNLSRHCHRYSTRWNQWFTITLPFCDIVISPAFVLPGIFSEEHSTIHILGSRQPTWRNAWRPRLALLFVFLRFRFNARYDIVPSAELDLLNKIRSAELSCTIYTFDTYFYTYNTEK